MDIQVLQGLLVNVVDSIKLLWFNFERKSCFR